MADETDVGQLKNLQILELQHNRLTDILNLTHDRGFSGLTALECLDLSRNAFGHVPSALGALRGTLLFQK
jgi:Leucine-rich repeat (LRR) protein